MFLRHQHLSACSTAASTWPGLLFQVPSPSIGIFVPLLRVREVVAILVVIFKLPAYRANVHKGSERFTEVQTQESTFTVHTKWSTFTVFVQRGVTEDVLSFPQIYKCSQRYTRINLYCICPDRGHWGCTKELLQLVKHALSHKHTNTNSIICCWNNVNNLLAILMQIPSLILVSWSSFRILNKTLK